MKLQFSLATLLVCMTVLALVCAIAACVKVHAMTEWEPVTVAGRPLFQWSEFDRAPNVSESAGRVLIWGSPSVVATLAVLWTIRRLKSHRHTEPPVG